MFRIGKRRGVLLQRLPQVAGGVRPGTNQAATWNSSATKLAWARMPRPPMLRAHPFLAIAMAS